MVIDDANNNTNKKKSEKNLLDFFQTFVSKITDVHDFYDQTNVLFTLRTWLLCPNERSIWEKPRERSFWAGRRSKLLGVYHKSKKTSTIIQREFQEYSLIRVYSVLVLLVTKTRTIRVNVLPLPVKLGQYVCMFCWYVRANTMHTAWRCQRSKFAQYMKRACVRLCWSSCM